MGGPALQGLNYVLVYNPLKSQFYIISPLVLTTFSLNSFNLKRLHLGVLLRKNPEAQHSHRVSPEISVKYH